ncbi:uncharacterized protein Z519_12426 [Cladophialophora bantiana CBS 173.52]|uniref:Transcription factor domain-containing protein n=1 Tax=Cladophialophora bantiana (strain ATCC 10958 / CBS 173.52 / CDC B-1940 / NIH 8579) TaxID=1442370 RepID=A0A0D2EA42_CLAB1|nr:uncharacterized protein Z519_12426 [Cladophialophora bantiana CBS 173.52]KIW86961.1 hypothetical protein Z519_12426 [Cladophialophora bantiana CBS 173.52]
MREKQTSLHRPRFPVSISVWLARTARAACSSLGCRISIHENGGNNWPDCLESNRIAQSEATTDHLAPVIPLTQSERLAATLITVLERPSGFGARLQQIGSYFGQLPPRLGCSVALDAAVNCLLYSFTAVSVGEPRNNSLELVCYCTAISALRRELAQYDDNGLLSTPSETLCASLLLAQYEILKPGPAYTFVTLSGGVSAILRGCGPGRVQSSQFEVAIFMTQYPTIITQCMLRGEDCFLSGPEWANTMRRTWNGYESSITAELWTALARLPGLQVRARAIDRATPSSSSSNLDAELLSQIYNIRASIVFRSDAVTHNLSTPSVYATYPRAYRGLLPVRDFRPETKLESLQPARYIKQATFYHTCTILVNTVLQSLLSAPNPAISLQTSQSATYILETLDFAKTTKPFGAFYMTFAGPLCYGVLADSMQKEMLLAGMKRIFDDAGIVWTHLSMQGVFAALTKGGWRNEVVLTKKRLR